MVDQNSQFYAILTNVGAAKQANADALGIPWKITQMGVGDANGADPTPNATQTSLINEWRRAPLNQLKVDDKNSAIIVAEQVIPADVGGKWIREIALYDADGDMIAVANCAPTYKPLLSQGSGRTQVVRMNLIVSSASSVQLKIDPAVVLATREYVDNAVIEAVARLDFKHSVLVATTGNIALSGIQTIDGVLLPADARVLVKDQAQAKDNGIYVVPASGAWKRAQDADTSLEVTPGLFVSIETGTLNGDSIWQLVTDAPIVLGTTPLVFEMAAGRSGISAGSYANVTVDKYGRVIAGTNPTTLEGYGIKDAYTKAESIAAFSSVVGSTRNAKMFVGIPSASAVYVADELIVESATNGQTFRLSNFNKAINIAITGVGGMDVGAAPVTGFVAIYAIYNPNAPLSPTNPGLLGVNATSARVGEVYVGANMPSGYTASCLLTVVPIASSKFSPCAVRGREVHVGSFYVYITNAIVTNILVSAATLVPFNAVSMLGTMEATCTAAAQLGILLTDGYLPGLAGLKIMTAGVVATGTVTCPFGGLLLTDSREFAISTSFAGTGGTPTYKIAVSGYVI